MTLKAKLTSKIFVYQNILSRKLNDNLQNSKKYLQITYLTKDLYPRYINNADKL